MADTRAELEARLKSASDSISNRLRNMEDSVKLPAVLRAGASVESKTAKRVGLAVLLGLGIGLAFGGSKRKKSGMTEELIDTIKDRVKTQPAPRPIIEEETAKKGVIAFVVGYAFKAAMNAAVKELVNRSFRRNGEQETP
ncbi:MAG: hypothetical protein JJ896_17405 [Rhodothermales bacterium]|nr:hypothetical protein [Rhodothermales bacterium]MBO6781439.1 hypothetical protein [Rhodothermales bacterium]